MIWALHGAVGLASDWEAFAKAMEARGETVRAVDLWGYVERDGVSLEEFGERFCEEVAAEDEAPVLLGYSMGGRLGMHALLAKPELWKGAVIVSAHPGLREEKERILRMGSDAEWAAQALRGDWELFLRRWNEQPVLRDSGEDGLEDRGQLRERREAVVRSFLSWSLGVQGDLRGRIGEIACPVLWVNGERDEKFCRLGEEAAGLLRDGRQVVMAGAGHRVPWEAPAEFVAEVGRFLKVGLG